MVYCKHIKNNSKRNQGADYKGVIIRYCHDGCAFFNKCLFPLPRKVRRIILKKLVFAAAMSGALAVSAKTACAEEPDYASMKIVLILPAKIGSNYVKEN